MKKVLIVANYNRGRYAPFIVEQAETLQRAGVEVAWLGVRGHGVVGYLGNYPQLRKAIAEERPDVVHAHYGFCGILACMQRQVPVVTTYHGSDINSAKIRRLCRIALRQSACNIFVSEDLKHKAGRSHNAIVLPCGVNLDQLTVTPKHEARELLGLDMERKYVLFASAFDNKVKNAPLAQEAMRQLPHASLIELKGYSRRDVALLMRAVDCLLMTSHSEGSPQVVKEALAQGTPIVSVEVGDVAWLIEGVEGCYLAERNADAIAQCLHHALGFGGDTQGRQRIIDLGLDNRQIAIQLTSLYNSLQSS